MRPRQKVIKNKVKCLKCNTIIESFHCHDFKSCPCQNIYVDGGTDYIRRLGPGLMDGTIEDLSEFEDED